MPPKSKKQADSEDDFSEEDPSEHGSDDASEEEEKPKKKAPAKKAPAKKAAAKKKADSDDFLDDSEDEKPKKKAPAKRKAPAAADGEEKPKKPRAPKVAPPKTVTTLPDGWVAHPPGLLVKDFGAAHSTKIAAFDFDGTLVINSSGMQFPKDANDWQVYNPKVLTQLKSYQEQGYKLVIFTNQGSIKSALTGAASDKARGRVSGFIEKHSIPAVVLMATQTDEFRKPGTGMWDFMCSNFMNGEQPDLSESFFVGDSIDGGDEGFARAVGIKFTFADKEFGGPDYSQGAQGPNAALVGALRKVAAESKEDFWASKAYKGAADALEACQQKITNTPEMLKVASGLKGVGKGSLALIKEFLETGAIAARPPKDKAAPKDGKESKAKNVSRDEALQFM